jgi:hypothetical protein
MGLELELREGVRQPEIASTLVEEWPSSWVRP